MCDGRATGVGIVPAGRRGKSVFREADGCSVLVHACDGLGCLLAINSNATWSDASCGACSYLFSALIFLALARTAVRGQSLPQVQGPGDRRQRGQGVLCADARRCERRQLMDIVALTEDALLWYENPSWTKHEIIRGKTEP